VIPATWEEYQQERRVAFHAGAVLVFSDTFADWPAEAARRYPITHRVLRTAGIGTVQARAVDELHVTLLFSGAGGSTVPMTITRDHVRKLVDLLDNPTEEVTE
jgi:hypothetical protein